jgi:hypothetical protein
MEKFDTYRILTKANLTLIIEASSQRIWQFKAGLFEEVKNITLKQINPDEFLNDRILKGTFEHARLMLMPQLASYIKVYDFELKADPLAKDEVKYLDGKIISAPSIEKFIQAFELKYTNISITNFEIKKHKEPSYLFVGSEAYWFKAVKLGLEK